MGKSKLYERYEQDKDKGEAGLWITDLLIPVKIHALSSRRVKLVREEARKLFLQAETANNGTLPPEKQVEKATFVLAHGVVSNWGAKAALADGVKREQLGEDPTEAQDRDGNDLPFTVENAMRLFKDLDDFRDDVMVIAASRETFRKSSLEGVKGNSAAPSQPASPLVATS